MYLNNLFKHWTYRLFAPGILLREKYEAFRQLLGHDQRSHELIAELQEIHQEAMRFDFSAVRSNWRQLSAAMAGLVDNLLKMHPSSYVRLPDYLKKIDFYVDLALSPKAFPFAPPFVLGWEEIGAQDGDKVGGKALSLARIHREMGLPVAEGFVVTANAFGYFLEANGLRGAIDGCLAQIDLSSPGSLETAVAELQSLIRQASIPEAVASEIVRATAALAEGASPQCRFSVRSSAVGEDSGSTYAGQYLSVLEVP